jgi:hypothetical protein
MALVVRVVGWSGADTTVLELDADWDKVTPVPLARRLPNLAATDTRCTDLTGILVGSSSLNPGCSITAQATVTTDSGAISRPAVKADPHTPSRA